MEHGGRGLISTEMCVRLKANNLCLYNRGPNEMLLKGVNKVGIVKTENLMQKAGKMSLKTNGKKRECMDSLFVKCMKK